MQIRDRIIELRKIKASELLKNPKNWRTHPKEQADALKAVLQSVGFAGAELTFETPNGTMLIDGHLRQELSGDELIPCLITDLTQEEADLILSSFDPIGDMARKDQAKLDDLISGIESKDTELQKLLDSLATPAEPEQEVELKHLDTKPHRQ